MRHGPRAAVFVGIGVKAFIVVCIAVTVLFSGFESWTLHTLDSGHLNFKCFQMSHPLQFTAEDLVVGQSTVGHWPS